MSDCRQRKKSKTKIKIKKTRKKLTTKRLFTKRQLLTTSTLLFTLYTMPGLFFDTSKSFVAKLKIFDYKTKIKKLKLDYPVKFNQV